MKTQHIAAIAILAALSISASARDVDPSAGHSGDLHPPTAAAAAGAESNSTATAAASAKQNQSQYQQQYQGNMQNVNVAAPNVTFGGLTANPTTNLYTTVNVPAAAAATTDTTKATPQSVSVSTAAPHIPDMPANTATAPSLTIGSLSCGGSVSAGAQGHMFGFSIGGTKEDPKCDLRQDVLMLTNVLNDKASAIRLICQTRPDLKKALGDQCN